LQEGERALKELDMKLNASGRERESFTKYHYKEMNLIISGLKQ
jgi:hypothetical protein